MRFGVVVLALCLAACGDDDSGSGADAGVDSGVVDGGVRDAGPLDGGSDLGSTDGGADDGGGDDAGTVSPRLQAITSGGGRASSPMYRLQLRVGGPAPHQNLQSPSYRLRPSLAGGSR